MTELIGILWNNFLVNPMINGTILLDRLLFGNFGLAIIVLTLIMRGLTLPLTLRQMHSQRKMTSLQPQISEIQKRTKSDPKRRSEETMALYKQEGVNPAGCLFPMLVQFPLWIALYNVIRTVLGSTPESLIDLSSRLYPWSFIQQAVPVANRFLFWDMGKPDQTYLLPVLVGGSMWLQQKLTMTKAQMLPGNQQQQQTNQMLLWMMPLMFGWFTLTVPSGLAIYWLVTNVIGVVMNYYVFGWRGTNWREIFLTPAGATSGGSRPRPADAAAERGRSGSTAAAVDRPRVEKRGANGRNGRGGSKRKDDRRSDRPSTPAARSRSESGRGGGS